MKELVIKLTGEITKTNFAEWKKELLAALKKVNTDLKTDDDFRQIKVRKAEIRDELVDEGVEQIQAFINDQSDALQSVSRHWLDRSPVEAVTKGKRTADSTEKAIKAYVSELKHEIANRQEQIDSNQQAIDNIDEDYSALFQDTRALLVMDTGKLQNTIAERIDFYREEQKKQAEADQAETTAPTTDTAPANDPEPAEAQNDKPLSSGGLPFEEAFVVSIEVFASADDAQEFADEIESRYSNREYIGEVRIFKP